MNLSAQTPVQAAGQLTPPLNGSLERTFVATALVSGLFGLLICAAMIFYHIRSKSDDPLKAPQIAALKEQLRAAPQNEQLKQTIRELDLQVRRRYFHQLGLVTTGGYLALGGLVVFLVSAKYLRARRQKIHLPQLKNESPDAAVRAAAWMRWSVAAAGGIVGITLFSLSFSSGTGLAGRLSALEKLAGAGSETSGGATTDFASTNEMQRNWPRFLGPDGNAFSTQTNFPLTWDVKTGAGIVWKVAVPAPGYNSPVTWGDRVFISGGDREKREVFCFRARSGELLWQRVVRIPPAGASESWEVPESAGAAASTMATDGRRIYALFANGDLAAFDLNGSPAWSKNLGRPKNTFGHASSLAVWQGRLIVQLDQGESDDRMSRLYAFDGATGRMFWQRPRPVPISWATPSVITAAGKAQIITLGVPWVISYSAVDGTEHWRAELLSGEVTPSPIFAGGLVFVISPNERLAAIRPDGQGDVTKTHIAWSSDENVPDITSPVSNGELIFTLSTPGLLACHDLKDGKRQWEHDFNLEFHASPAIAGDRLYLIGVNGTVVVAEVGRRFKELARSEMPGKIFASPAFASSHIFIRSEKHLYCLGAAEDKLARQ